MTRNQISGLINRFLNPKMKISAILKLQILYSLLLFSAAGNLYSQTSVSHSALQDKKCQEQLYIITDRDIYITGEKVWFNINQLYSNANSSLLISRIIYLELLDALNNPVIQVKIQTNGSIGFSNFRLPDDMTSGNYLLRAYTRWMQNFSPDVYAYKTISIINPFTGIKSLIPGPGESFSTGYQNPIEKEKILIQTVEGKENKSSLNLIIAANKPEYGKREKAIISVNIADKEKSPGINTLSLSVVKTVLHIGNRNYPGRTSPENNVSFSPAAVTPILPEPEGMLITGVIKNKETEVPLKNTDISLSFVGKSARCMFTKTNSKGEFLFVGRDIFGLNEIVIQPVVKSDSASYAELNQPFSNSFNNYTPGRFLPDSSLIGDINKAIIAMQVSAIYDPLKTKNIAASLSHTPADFFGKPSEKVRMADYIELTDVREVLKELIPEVILVHQDDEYTIRVVSPNPYEDFKNQALVLVDGVPFYNIEELINMRANKLESVDYINTRYFYNGFIFYGIVSFVTKKGNLSAFEFDDSVYRRVFEGSQPAQEFYTPDYSVDSLRMSRLPDFRNTLCWEPALKISPGGKSSVEFYTSDETGNFTIIIEGTDNEGNQVYLTSPLIVR